jgi:hypothetical protein
MKKNAGKSLIFGILLLSLLFTSACTSQAQEAVQTAPAPVVHVTQFVTQVVATSLPATPTPVPTFTSAAPPTYSGWDPLRQPVYYPVMGCVASRLHIGDPAFVAYISGVAGVYMGKDIYFAPLVRRPVAGEMVEIVGGPWCQQDNLIWEVFLKSEGKNGFMPEGNGQEYWLLPLQPYTPTP